MSFMLLIEKLSREIVLTIMRGTEKSGQVQEASAVFLKAKIVWICFYNRLGWSRRQDGNHGGFTREIEATHMSI